MYNHYWLRPLLLSSFLFGCLYSEAQVCPTFQPKNTKLTFQLDIAPDVPFLLQCVSMFATGLWHGRIETLDNHYERFQINHPNKDPQLWNPDISWTNKYKNNDINQGRAFLFSTTLLVWTTDKPHELRWKRTGGWMFTILLEGQSLDFSNLTNLVNSILRKLPKMAALAICYRAGVFINYDLE